MTRETRNSKRLVPTKPVVRDLSLGNPSAITPSPATTTWETLTIPVNTRFVAIKNSGNQDLIFRFNSDPETQFYVLDAGQQLPFALQVGDGTQLHYRSSSATVAWNLLIWG